jgi:hypothetical protein
MLPAIAAEGINRPAAPRSPISFFIVLEIESESCLCSRHFSFKRAIETGEPFSQVCGIGNKHLSTFFHFLDQVSCASMLLIWSFVFDWLDDFRFRAYLFIFRKKGGLRLLLFELAK